MRENVTYMQAGTAGETTDAAATTGATTVSKLVTSVHITCSGPFHTTALSPAGHDIAAYWRLQIGFYAPGRCHDSVISHYQMVL